MKKSKKISAGIVALLLVTCVAAGSIYARYTGTATGTDRARVARFDYYVNTDEAGHTDQYIEIDNLFTASYKGSTMDYDNDTTFVQSYNGEDVIAPGSYGFVKIHLKNNSEVRLVPTWFLRETKSDNNIPLQYAIIRQADSTVEDVDFLATTAVRHMLENEEDYHWMTMAQMAGVNGYIYQADSQTATGASVAANTGTAESPTKFGNTYYLGNSWADSAYETDALAFGDEASQDDEQTFYLFWMWPEGEHSAANGYNPFDTDSPETNNLRDTTLGTADGTSPNPEGYSDDYQRLNELADVKIDIRLIVDQYIPGENYNYSYLLTENDATTGLPKVWSDLDTASAVHTAGSTYDGTADTDNADESTTIRQADENDARNDASGSAPNNVNSAAANYERTNHED